MESITNDALAKLTEDWRPLREAEAVTGVAVATMRKWYRYGRIRSELHRGPRGDERWVELGEVRQESEKNPRFKATNFKALVKEVEAQNYELKARVDKLEIALHTLSGRHLDHFHNETGAVRH